MAKSERERQLARAYYLAHKEQWREYSRRGRLKRDPKKHAAANLAFYYRNRDRMMAKFRARYKKSPNSKVTNRKLRLASYGLTAEVYAAKVAAQDGVCAICLKPETLVWEKTKTVRLLSVDHNHATGEVRDLLCQRCNTAVGMLKEDPQIALQLAAYLTRWSKEQKP